MSIPVIDIFAGPGGLGEGFCSLTDENGDRIFETVLSIEMDKFAHQTLTLRSFYRKFNKSDVPQEYYEFLKQNISIEELFKKYPKQAAEAKDESWRAKLGTDEKSEPSENVDYRIKKALNGYHDWILLGGPPCQAYSVVGRSRRQEKILDENKDERVGLYKQYLRILAFHNPALFVMENVKGMLSAKTNDSPVFLKVLSDLENPVYAYLSENGRNGRRFDCPGYKIYSLTVPYSENQELFEKTFYEPRDFIIKCEDYGIPQARHRIILLGVRKGLEIKPGCLSKKQKVPVNNVLEGLPRIRSGLSKTVDNNANWKKVLQEALNHKFLEEIDPKIAKKIKSVIRDLRAPRLETGNKFVYYPEVSVKHDAMDWYVDPKLEGVCNHDSRGHMESDLYRYLFAACYAKVKLISPRLADFPNSILPRHKNISEGIVNAKFADRFRVQVENEPARTITSHISKDGHYYIHPDPTQCRSLTVREAARIQTFPDNYYFCGTRTSQFTQVGNAVPPYLAKQISVITVGIFESMEEVK